MSERTDAVELTITVGEAKDGNITLAGVIAEDIEVTPLSDFIEPAVIEHIEREYGIDVFDHEMEKDDE